jgi:hypothetical protein
MSVITVINSGDFLEPTSRTNINTNFANLNTDKQEKPGGAVTNNIVLFGAANVLVDSGKAVPTGNIVGTTDSQALTNKDLSSGTNVFPTSLVTLTGSQTLTNKNLTAPTIGDFTNANHNHQNAAGGGTLAEAALSLSNVTTNDVSITKHGFTPIAPNDTTKFLRGDATWGVPPTGTLAFNNGETTRSGNAASGSQTIAHGLGKTPKYARFVATFNNTGNGANMAFSEGTYNGNTNAYVYSSVSSSGANVSVSGGGTGQVLEIGDSGSLSSNQIAVATWDATNLTLTWTKTGALGGGNINILWEAWG